MCRSNIALEDFQMIYEPLVQYLESITPTDGWDENSVIQALWLLKLLINST